MRLEDWIDSLYDNKVSILILLDYLFLYRRNDKGSNSSPKVSILILLDYLFLSAEVEAVLESPAELSQSLFYWITYSYTPSGW